MTSIERIRQALAAGPTQGPLVVENDMVYRESDEDLERPLIHVNTTQFTEHEFFGLVAVDALWFATCTPETIRSLLSRLDELEKDAARYRWLREHPTFLGWEHDFRADEVDAAIDSAIAKGA